jgi:15-cis-phytoene synthase
MPASSPELQPADLDVCRALLRHGSKSFFTASLLLPRDVREDAAALYAFCRVADDAIDDAADPRAGLKTLHARLDGLFGGGRLTDPIDRAAASVIARHDLPRSVLEALLEGFAWDAEGRSYETLPDILAYSARVAATVGVLMTLIMGERDAATLARACDLGVAMQLTNIARDVGEDARNGRLYLPRQWLREAGLDPDGWLAAPRFDARLASVVQRLLGVADDLYRRSRGGVGDLPRDCRAAIHAARLVYAEIGACVAANGYDSVSRRAVVCKRDKLALVGKAVAAGWLPARNAGEPALPEVRFLVQAAARTPDSAARRAPSSWPRFVLKGFRLRTIGVLTLLESVEQRRFGGQQAGEAAGP